MTHHDETCSQYAEAFLGNLQAEVDIPFRPNLNAKKLDYSLKSLKLVDEYLDHVRDHISNLTQIEYQQMVVWAGAYVGETIRRNAKAEFHWVDHKEYIVTEAGSKLKDMMPYTLGTHLLLLATSGTMTLPINKVVRNLEEGPENNLHYYASGDINRS